VSTHKIVVIDDSKVIRMHVKDMLPGNFEVVEAKNGLEGFDLIRSENPNLIMLDFLLPKMSGWEVYQEIQKDPRLQAIPLVMMSGRKEEVTEKLPEPFEFFAFVEKPFDKKQLVDAIKEAMDKSKKRKELIGDKPQVAPSSDSSGEIQLLKDKVATLEQEMESVKKQLNQLVNFIKQKMK
jgi:CheY-like chemotaxis protein